jgi:hypothetical protein
MGVALKVLGTRSPNLSRGLVEFLVFVPNPLYLGTRLFQEGETFFLPTQSLASILRACLNGRKRELPVVKIPSIQAIKIMIGCRQGCMHVLSGSRKLKA